VAAPPSVPGDADDEPDPDADRRRGHRHRGALAETHAERHRMTKLQRRPLAFGRHLPQPAVGVDGCGMPHGGEQWYVGDRVGVGVRLREVVALLRGEGAYRLRLRWPGGVEVDLTGVA